MNIDKSEIENFDNYAHEWWIKRGPYKFIHLLTPLRMKYISNNFKLKGSKVLDLGCGGGLLCEAMTERGADVVGIDASLKTIEIAKKHANEKNLKIDYLNTDIESFNYKENFDAVICFELIEHVPNPNELIAQISKLIKPKSLKISPINMECILYKIVDLPVLNEGEYNGIIIGKVIGISIEDDYIKDGKVDVKKLKPLARLGYMDYSVIDNIFEMNRPSNK